ncbi:hypothetical protein R6Q59_008676 [Mikania micrantha]
MRGGMAIGGKSTRGGVVGGTEATGGATGDGSLFAYLQADGRTMVDLDPMDAKAKYGGSTAGGCKGSMVNCDSDRVSGARDSVITWVIKTGTWGPD